MTAAACDAPLLATKLFVPPPRPNRVVRPRLRELLSSRRGGTVTLVSAPAGSGKSTLLADWVSSEDGPVAWISLDDGDDDASRLLGCIATSLCRSGAIGDEIVLETTLAKTREARDAALTNVINAIARLGHDLSLILDDYHVVTVGEAHELVQLIADHLPSNLHLVISSRVDPPLALSRLRARDKMVELRAADLRFTVTEAAEFLNGAMSLGLTDGQVDELERRTEGWAVGLQMAAISLRGRGEAERFIRGFSGSNRYILDYLTDEVLAGEPAEVRSFLLQTAILDRLSAPLCNAVTGRSDSEQILRRLDAANMFLIPLDDVRYWYRYHHLFATVLMHQMERSESSVSSAELHRRASSWYAANQLPDHALRHALLAGDVERATEIVSENALPRLLAGETALVVHWIDQLAATGIRPGFELMLVEAMALRAEYQLDRALEVVTRLCDSIGPGTTPFDLGRYLAVSGSVAHARGDNDRALSELPRAIKLLPEDSFWSALASFHLGLNLFTSVDLAGAERVFARVRLQQHGPDSIFMGVLAHGYAARCRLWLGRPAEAVRLAEQSLEAIAEIEARSGEAMPLGAMPYAALADVYVEWNDIARAKDLAMRALERGRRGFGVAFFEASRSMVRIAEADGDWPLAMQSIADARAMVTVNPSWMRALVGLFHRVVLHRGIVTANEADLATVAAWIEHEGLDRYRDRWPHAREAGVYADFGFLTTARYFIETGKFDDAIGLLEMLLADARAADRTFSIVDILILRALAEGRKGVDAAAVETMTEALTLASAPRFVRLFVHEGEAILPLVKRAAPRIADGEFAARLLSAFQAPGAPAKPAAGLREALSERELEVLQLLATGAANQAIGRKLFIAANTVKKHLEHIYAKLGVGGRGEAVARARELGIL